jgi:hypothetical protein
MPEPDFFLTQNDTSSAIARTLEDENGVAIDLTGATVKFLLRPINGTTNKINAAATIVGAATLGNVSYAWTGTDTSTAGLFVGQWQVTYSNGKVQTFPNGAFDLVLISPDLGS